MKPRVTEIKCEDVAGKQFSASINGRNQSGLCEGATDWMFVDNAIKDLGGFEQALVDKTIAPYVDRSKDPKEIARRELAELDKIIPRFFEEFIDLQPQEIKDAYLATKTSVQGMNKGDVKSRKETLRETLK